MYLESRVLELLALQLNQFLHCEQSGQAVANLRAIDVEKGYHTRDILIRRAENPPSFMELLVSVTRILTIELLENQLCDVTDKPLCVYADFLDKFNIFVGASHPDENDIKN